MKLSHKKHNELYRVVSDKVMELRLKIIKMQDGIGNLPYSAIDFQLAKLMDEAGQAAIHVFEPPKK